MSELIDIIISAVDEASSTFESIVGSAEDAQSSLEGMGGSAESIPTDAIENTANAVDNVEQEANESATALENINNIITGMAGVEVFSSMADSLMDLADKAGNYQDSMMRASLEAEGAGISTNEMTDALSKLSSETGRAGSELRESFIKATARGITDMDSFQKMMVGAGAQATLFGTDIQTMGDKFSGLAFNTNLMPKALKETGITMDELGTAMGMTGATADEVKEKWKELDANQRAAALGMAASMNEGEDANEAYKNSWAGLHAQIDIARGRIERLAGQVLLPVLVPAMQVAADVLNFLGDTIQGVMDGPLGGLVSVIGTVAAGIALAVPAIAAIQAGLTLFTATIWPAVTASWALLAPWLPWIAIGAAIVYIIYEIGKAFGWWTDASSAIEAVEAGLRRLWNAFINHPDVQAAIQELTDVWNWLVPAVTGVVDKIKEFFNISSDNKFDAVRAIIDGIGAAWDGMKSRAMLATTVVQTVIGFFEELYNRAKPVIDNLSDAFVTAWTTISSFLMPIINTISGTVTGLMNVFNSFRQGQIDLPTAIITALTILWNGYFTILTQVGQFVLQIANRVIQYGIRMGSQFVNRVLSYIRQLPGKVYTALHKVVSRIQSAIQAWITAAQTKVSTLISNITSPFSGVADKISGALSGVADALLKPFRDAWTWIKPYYDKIKEAMDIVPGLDARGGEEAEGRQSLLIGATDHTTTTTTPVKVENEPLSVDINQNITLDLANVPAHIDTNTLIQMLNDKKVLSALTSNNDFQSLDAKVKERLNLKVNRARGV